MKNNSASFKKFFNPYFIKSNPLILVIIGLLFFGLYFVFNATVISSLETYGNPYRFAIFHLIWILIGLILFWYFYNIDLFKLRKFTYILYALTLVSLLPLFVARFFPCDQGFEYAPCTNGAIRWLVLNPSPLPKLPFIGTISFQPSELAKLTLVLLTSFLLTKETLNFKQKLKRILFFTLPLVFLVFFQPNKSTSFIMLSIIFSIYFIYGQKLKLILYASIPLFVLFLVFILLNSYSLNRVLTFLSINENESSNYHAKQVQISLGSGGIFGVGLGQSRQKFSFLPEISSDSIFAIIGEEAGIIGSLIVLGASVYLIFLGVKIAENQSENYYKLLAIGITTWYGIQSIVNIGAMVGLIPLTGVPLPLISYGGSSTIFIMIGFGILANISKNVFDTESYLKRKQ
jgi:cell division protein FtsW